MPGWSTEELKKLRELWDDGLTCGQISRQMEGKSRNSVIGIAHRIGLNGRPNPIKRHTTMAPMNDQQRRDRRIEQQAKRRDAEKREKPKAAPAEKPVAAAPMHKRGIVYVSGPRSIAPAQTEIIEPAGVGRFTLAQVQAAHSCLWGFGHVPHMTFCGKPRDPKDPAHAYCTDHVRIAYRWAAE